MFLIYIFVLYNCVYIDIYIYICRKKNPVHLREAESGFPATDSDGQGKLYIKKIYIYIYIYIYIDIYIYI